jgi:hypothetical protein
MEYREYYFVTTENIYFQSDTFLRDKEVRGGW